MSWQDHSAIDAETEAWSVHSSENMLAQSIYDEGCIKTCIVSVICNADVFSSKECSCYIM